MKLGSIISGNSGAVSSSATQIAANQASQSLPSINTPAQVSRGLKYFTIFVRTGTKYPQVFDGNYVYIDRLFTTVDITSTAGLTVRPDSTNATVDLRYAKQGTTWPQAFSKVEFENTSGSDLTIYCWIGFGYIQLDTGGGGAVTTIQNIRDDTFTFTRPANVTPYAAGQIVGQNPGQSMLFTVLFNSQTGTIGKVRLFKSTNVVANASFRLYLFNTIQSGATVQDQTVFQLDFATWAGIFLGVVEFPSMIAGGGAGAVCEVSSFSLPIDLNTSPQTNLFGLLVATAAYVPGNAEQFRVDIVGAMNA